MSFPWLKLPKRKNDSVTAALVERDMYEFTT